MERDRPLGRPSEYRPEYCEKVIELFRQGMSKAEVCSELDICFNTLENWQKENDAFLKAVTRGLELSQAWWERQAREGLYKIKEYDGETKQSFEKSINERLWFLNMKNRFKKDWQDKQEIETTGGSSLNINFNGDSDPSDFDEIHLNGK